MAEAPAGDKILTEEDAAAIMEELTKAQNKAKLLGLMLGIKPVEVETICKMCQDPKERLSQIILAFLRQAEPPPMWRAIVNALKSATVNLTGLAKRVEAAHFPDPTASRDPPTTSVAVQGSISHSVESQVPTDQKQQTLAPPANADPDQQSSSSSSVLVKPASTESDATSEDRPELARSSEEVKKIIDKLDEGFYNLKNTIRECLEKQKVVSQVADVLTSLSPDDDKRNKIFTESHITILYRAANISEQFGTMNFHWNYLDPSLLEHLVKKFNLEKIKDKMERYKSDLQQFRKKTPLILFCQAQKRKRIKPQENFKELVAEFEWPEDVTLEDVEQFRQEYASEYNLHKCAMMIAEIRDCSYIITWFIPESIVKKLKTEIPKNILKEYSVTKLVIAGICVYYPHKTQKEVSVPSSGTGNTLSVRTTGLPAPPFTLSLDQPKPLPEEDYQFVVQPSKDFFCPVTFGLLLQPHLTPCCGNHFSQEAASMIQEEGGACPLCKANPLHTMLNKHFQRQVKSLRVFCHHDERGCGWQGELANFDSHVQSCPMRDIPLMTELMKLPLYGGDGATKDQATDHDPWQQIINTTDEPRIRSGVAGLYVDADFIYYSCTEVPLETETNSQDNTEKKYCVQKCDHKGKLICSAYFKSFIRGIGMDHQGFLYVVCSAVNSQVFKLDKDFNPVRKTANELSRYLGVAYELLVMSDHVLVCSMNKRSICILDLNLNLHFNLNLNFGPLGITIFNGRYIVTGKGTIGVIDMDFKSKTYKIMTLKEMKIDHGTEVFKKDSIFRSICASNEYLLVTEINETGGRLLCLQLIGNHLRCVAIKKGFSQHCSDTCDKKCSPQVVTHCNGASYYSQGRFDGKYHIVRVTIQNNVMKTKKMFDC